MNCKRFQESIANCVSCVCFPDEKFLGEQEAKVVVQIKRLSSPWGDTCRRACAKVRTQSVSGQQERWRGQAGGVVPAQALLFPVKGTGDSTACWWRRQATCSGGESWGPGAWGLVKMKDCKMRGEVRGGKRGAASHYTNTDTESGLGLVPGKAVGGLVAGRHARDRHVGFPLA